MTSVPVSVLDVVLGAAAVAAAVVVLIPGRRVTATMAFPIFGVLLAVLWARLGAPDIALAEAAIGTGVTGALFVDAVTRSRPVPAQPRGATVATAVFGTVWGVLAGAGLATILLRAAAVGGADPATAGLEDEVRARVGQSGVEHPVTAVLLNFRSYDTLLEIAVLVVAVLAVSVPSASVPSVPVPSVPVSGGTGPRRSVRSPTLAWFCAVLTPVLLLVAAWVLFAGVDRPGGAFQAGAVLAGALILLTASGLGPDLGRRGPVRVAVVAGLIVFIGVAGLGLLTGGAWLALDPSWAGWVIVAVESLLAVGIGVALTMVFLAVGRGREATR